MNDGKEALYCDLTDIEKTSQMAKALSSPVRLEMLRLLIGNSMTMSELSHALYLSMSSVCMHTNILKETGLITVTPKPGMHGSQKLCGIKAGLITFDLFASSYSFFPPLPKKVVEIPVGSYCDCDITPPCGLSTSTSYVDCEDTPYSFYHPSHINAQLLWFTTGYLTYRFPNKDINMSTAESVAISFEVCAEAPGYNNNWPSDISIRINGVSLTTFTVKGDYGGQHGKLTPKWWSDSKTQYGELRTLLVSETGCYLNGNLVSDATLESLHMRDNYYFTFTIGVDRDSKYPGGMNLFGSNFGNYSQDFIMEIQYKQSLAESEGKTP